MPTGALDTGSVGGRGGVSSPNVIVPDTESVIGLRIKTTFSGGESGIDVPLLSEARQSLRYPNP